MEKTRQEFFLDKFQKVFKYEQAESFVEQLVAEDFEEGDILATTKTIFPEITNPISAAVIIDRYDIAEGEMVSLLNEDIIFCSRIILYTKFPKILVNKYGLDRIKKIFQKENNADVLATYFTNVDKSLRNQLVAGLSEERHKCLCKSVMEKKFSELLTRLKEVSGLVLDLSKGDAEEVLKILSPWQQEIVSAVVMMRTN